MARGPYKKATTVYASSCRVYKVSAKVQYVYIALCIHIIYIIYIYNTHGYIRVRRVCKHDPVE